MSMLHIVAMAAIITMAATYALFLWASWQQYIRDQDARNKAINDLLDRLPKPSAGEAVSNAA